MDKEVQNTLYTEKNHCFKYYITIGQIKPAAFKSFVHFIFHYLHKTRCNLSFELFYCLKLAGKQKSRYAVLNDIVFLQINPHLQKGLALS